jgi:hypothetical protein
VTVSSLSNRTPAQSRPTPSALAKTANPKSSQSPRKDYAAHVSLPSDAIVKQQGQR